MDKKTREKKYKELLSKELKPIKFLAILLAIYIVSWIIYLQVIANADPYLEFYFNFFIYSTIFLSTFPIRILTKYHKYLCEQVEIHDFSYFLGTENHYRELILEISIAIITAFFLSFIIFIIFY